MQVRATLVELWKRTISLVKTQWTEEIYTNGENNLYPNEIERVVNNSPTASLASGKFATFIAGRGVEGEDGELIDYFELPILDKRRGYRVTDITQMAARSMVIQGGAFFHIRFGLDKDVNVVPIGLTVLDYCKCKKGKDDDEGNEGKILYFDWEKNKGTGMFSAIFGGGKNKPVKFYPYTGDMKVTTARILADSDSEDITEAIKTYAGEVYYLNLNPELTYASSPFDSVFNDCDSEYRIGLYTNTQTRAGFLGKVVLLTQGLDDEKAVEVKEDLRKFLGAENSGSMYHLDVVQTDDLDSVLKIIQLKPQFDDKLFTETVQRIRKNILGAAKNIPERLVFAGDGAIFSASEGALEADKILYSENTEYERSQLKRAMHHMGFSVRIKPIADRVEYLEEEAEAEIEAAEEVETETPENETETESLNGIYNGVR